MKAKYIIAFFVFLAVLAFMFIFFSSKEVEVKATMSNSYENVITIKEDTDRYEIQAFYPETKNQKLDEVLKNKVLEYIGQFKRDIESNPKKSTLIIKFDPYEYGDYISFLFSYFVDTGGAHPNTYLSTETYNLKTNESVNIQDIMNKNKNFLKFISDFSYDKLKEDPKIQENINLDMLKEGTLPKKENFINFVFSNEGLKFFFQKYQVAPYSSGEFYVIVPYDKINL